MLLQVLAPKPSFKVRQGRLRMQSGLFRGTMTQLLESSVAQRRLSVRLLSGFDGVAMILAAIGSYGGLACNVTQRTEEIGTRIALVPNVSMF